MLNNLTKEDVEKFEYIEPTPAGGKSYYDEKLDIAVVVYKDYFMIYHTRRWPFGKFAAFFNHKIRVDIV